ncbi:MAG: FkbM family methyltransferase [Actinomycetota bacterium]|nr:FkbM family methyltransferase [Actinomycetota bacterium]
MPIDRLRRLLPRRHRNAPGDADRLRRMIELDDRLDHGDPGQLAFQISEIAGDRIYTKHGVEVGPGDVVIDAGGNIGVSAAHFALQCGAAEVHSFEPIPGTFDQLCQNVASIPACRPSQMGLGSENGSIEMTYFTGGDSVLSGRDVDPGEYREYLATVGRNLGLSDEEAERRVADRCLPHTAECEIVTLSSVIRERGIERIDLLKIDVEGAEVEVLDGIGDADWPRIRQVSAEVHSDELLESMNERLHDQGFQTRVEQDPQLTGTPIRMLYAVRPSEAVTASSS